MTHASCLNVYALVHADAGHHAHEGVADRNFSRGTSELWIGARIEASASSTRARKMENTTKAKMARTSFEAKASASRKKGYDESGKEREGQITRCDAPTASRRSAENATVTIRYACRAEVTRPAPGSHDHNEVTSGWTHALYGPSSKTSRVQLMIGSSFTVDQYVRHVHLGLVREEHGKPAPRTTPLQSADGAMILEVPSSETHDEVDQV